MEHLSPQFIAFVAFAIIACCVAVSRLPSDKRDARRRNPERTWDDRP